MKLTTESSPWKPCDLRGVFPDPVSPALFERVGRAVGTMLAPDARALVAGDFRLGTPTLKQALSDGLLSTGVNVLDAGQIPTPVAYFSARRLHADAVLIVTASHNPPSHNGLKWMIFPLPPTPEQVEGIRRLAASGRFRQGRAKSESVNLVPQYREFLIRRFQHLDAGCFSRIVLDAGNGAWAEIAPDIFRRLGFSISCLGCTPDGHFPQRSPDCSRPANLAGLRAAVAQGTNSLGIAWDGDGDRVAFLDETGAHAPADDVSLLLIRQLLPQPAVQESVVIDIKFSDWVRREVHARSGVPLLERSGHAFMRTRMLSERALLGVDACGHYFYRELEGGDDGLFSAFFVLDILQKAQQPLAEIRRSLPQIFNTPELRLPTELLDFPSISDRLKKVFSPLEVMETDGIRLVLEEGVVLARESSTESVVSLRIEGFDHAGYKTVLEQTMSTLPEARALLEEQLNQHRLPGLSASQSASPNR